MSITLEEIKRLMQIPEFTEALAARIAELKSIFKDEIQRHRSLDQGFKETHKPFMMIYENQDAHRCSAGTFTGTVRDTGEERGEGEESPAGAPDRFVDIENRYGQCHDGLLLDEFVEYLRCHPAVKKKYLDDFYYREKPFLDTAAEK